MRYRRQRVPGEQTDPGCRTHSGARQSVEGADTVSALRRGICVAHTLHAGPIALRNVFETVRRIHKTYHTETGQPKGLSV